MGCPCLINVESSVYSSLVKLKFHIIALITRDYSSKHPHCHIRYSIRTGIGIVVYIQCKVGVHDELKFDRVAK